MKNLATLLLVYFLGLQNLVAQQFTIDTSFGGEGFVEVPIDQHFTPGSFSIDSAGLKLFGYDDKNHSQLTSLNVYNQNVTTTKITSDYNKRIKNIDQISKDSIFLKMQNGNNVNLSPLILRGEPKDKLYIQSSLHHGDKIFVLGVIVDDGLTEDEVQAYRDNLFSKESYRKARRKSKGPRRIYNSPPTESTSFLLCLDKNGNLVSSFGDFGLQYLDYVINPDSFFAAHDKGFFIEGMRMVNGVGFPTNLLKLTAMGLTDKHFGHDGLLQATTERDYYLRHQGLFSDGSLLVQYCKDKLCEYRHIDEKGNILSTYPEDLGCRQLEDLFIYRILIKDEALYVIAKDTFNPYQVGKTYVYKLKYIALSN